MRQIYEMHAAGQSVRAIARTLGIARNCVCKYIRAPEVPKLPPRPPRGSKLDPYADYIHEQLARGVDEGPGVRLNFLSVPNAPEDPPASGTTARA